MTAAAVEAARAKVNLALHVVGRRADGYHLLDTLVAFPAIGDRVEVRQSDRLTLEVDGPGAKDLAGTTDTDNLVMRAATALRDAFGIHAGAAVRLWKDLPVAAGLGGGSADAAAAVRALSRIWRIDPDSAVVRDIAAGLGADVPMCLPSTPVRATGVGEILAEIPALPPLGILLANPRVGVPTPAVFRALRVRENPPLPALPAAFDAEALLAYLGACRNDLQAAAVDVAPAVAETLDAVEGLGGCRLTRMSGSGATCFGLFDDATAAAQAARHLAASRPDWWIRCAALA